MRSLLIDVILILCGMVLTPWAIIKWSELGFRLESKFYAGNRDGTFFLIAVLIGIALISYGILNALIFRRKSNMISTKDKF